MALFRRSLVLSVLICVGCSAQSAPSGIEVRIERQVRTFYSIPPDVKILIGPRKASEFPGYDALTITFNGGEKAKSYDFLLSKDQKTLLRMTKFDLTEDPYAAIMKKIDLSGRPVRGNKNAKVIAVNYDDYECPFCAQLHETLFPALMKEYGDRVQFVYKDFPLEEIHPWAMHAAVDADCVATQSSDAYWDFVDYLHAHRDEVNANKSRPEQFAELDHLASDQGQKHSLDAAKLEACLKAQNEDAVKASIKEGESLGVEATPTLFVNGEKVDGARPIADLRAVFDRVLLQAGVTPPAHPDAPTVAAAGK